MSLQKSSGIWSDHVEYENGISLGVTSDWSTINFSKKYSSPIQFTASMQTYNVRDSAHLRYQSLGTQSVKVKVEEDASKDGEVIHEMEDVGWMIFAGSGSIRAYPDDCYALRPTAKDLQRTAIVGEVSIVQLRDKSQKNISVFIQELPKNGRLFQYDKKLQTSLDLLNKGIPFTKPDALTDDKGRVLYVADAIEANSGSTDQFSFYLLKNNVRSNLATVTLTIGVPHSVTPGPEPQPQPQPQKEENKSMLGVVLISVVLVVLITVLGVLVMFLYKRNHTGTEVIDFVKATVTGADNDHMDGVRAGSTLVEDSVDSDDLDSD